MFRNGFDKKRDLFLILGTVAALLNAYGAVRTAMGLLSFVNSSGLSGSIGTMLAGATYTASLVGILSGILWVVFLFTAPFFRRANIFFVVSRGISAVSMLLSRWSSLAVPGAVRQSDMSKLILLSLLSLIIEAVFIAAGSCNFTVKVLNISAAVMTVISAAMSALSIISVAQSLMQTNIGLGVMAASWVTTAAELAVSAVFWFAAVGFRGKAAE